MERWLAKRTDALIAVSPQTRDELLGRGIGTPEKVHVIPLGFDLTPFLSVSGRSGLLTSLIDVPPDAPLVGVLGRLAPVKDVGTAIRAISGLADVHLAVIGDGACRERLHRVA